MEEYNRYKKLDQELREAKSMIEEEKDSELLYSIRRKKDPPKKGEEEESRCLVFFKVDKVLPLIGSGRAR